jgi:hypothetical protein
MPGFRRSVTLFALLTALIAALAAGLSAQSSNQNQAPPFPPPPATKLEAFQPMPGTVFSVAREDYGNVGGVSVEAQEIRNGRPVRGLIVRVNAERSFVDAEELPGLVRGCDTLLQVTSNPTLFKTYEAHYSTKGSLELSASTSEDRGVMYTVKVGRFRTASATLTESQVNQLRAIFAAAAEKFAALPD